MRLSENQPRQLVVNPSATGRLPGSPEITGMMQRAEIKAYCRREADRLRVLLLRTTTPAVKLRLLERIEEFERIAKGQAAEPPELELEIAKSRWLPPGYSAVLPVGVTAARRNG